MFWNLIRPFLFTLPPEEAHHLAFTGLELIQSVSSVRMAIEQRLSNDAICLRTKVFGLEFSNPIGLAAGFDKDARLLPMWKALGFGFAEVGTITPLPQKGNPPPRLFRFPWDQALINRMGFNNDGSEAIRARLLSLLGGSEWPSFPVGINLGKGKETPLEKAIQDYLVLLDSFLDLGDYFVINVSSPNTAELRELQEKSRLDDLFSGLQARNQTRCKPHVRPLLVKIAPDLSWSQLDDVLELCLKHRLSGIIATNTTLSRDMLSTQTQESGGLSGRPLREKSTEFIRYIYRHTEGKLPVIGVGGVFSAEDAYEKIRAGASLIQIYTGFIYQGPTMVSQITQGLAHLLKRDGFNGLVEAVGEDHIRAPKS